MFKKTGKWVTHTFTAVGMLAFLLIVLFYAAKYGQNLPIVGGPVGWIGSHASGSAEGF
jgi:hypothetical protein